MNAIPNLILGAAASEGWLQIGELAFAFGLSALIGLEREPRQKATGLRIYTLVGTGAALFIIVSKRGFGSVLAPGLVVLDPSRVAAGIVAVLALPLVARRLPRIGRTETVVQVVYRQGSGILPTILEECASQGFVVIGSRTRRGETDLERKGVVEVILELEGRRTPTRLGTALQQIGGVLEVHAADSLGGDA